MTMNPEYREKGYLIVERLISAELASFLSTQFHMIRQVDSLGRGDDLVPSSYAIYGAIPFETLMSNLCGRISELTGLLLVPTYSYGRIYDRGATLAKHRDRPACENSITLALGYDGDEPWPIHLLDKNGHEVVAKLKPGDGMIYRGCECAHWRDKFVTGTWQAQVFLHYVEKGGPNAAEEFDRRPALGLKLPNKRAI
ncbi:MAG: hypothetical protein KBA31_00955 [Alphaproteobacteria bacterium]|nr:hypothetical protein [Alphaproteobacteria bacterium]